MLPKRTLTLLHLDDSILELKRLKKVFEQPSEPFPVSLESFRNPQEYLDRIKTGASPDAVLMDIDLGMGSVDGFELSRLTREIHPEVVIIFSSGFADARNVTRAFEMGADEFISKKSDGDWVQKRILTAIQLASLRRPGKILGTEADANQPQLRKKSGPSIVGKTMHTIQKRIELMLKSAISSIYVEGETGTGKEVVADILESLLPERTPFVRINCGAIAPNLIEAELFGSRKGAYTGAFVDRQGLLEAASGGWVFFDEVSSLPQSAQASLLRVIENKELRRVGETEARHIDLKILAASNDPLKDRVKQGAFRADLWQRFTEGEIYLPSLRERKDEIPDLVRFFSKTLPGGPYQVTEPALEILNSYPWSKGNIRELRNCIKAMTEFQLEKLLTPFSIPKRIWDTDCGTETDSSELKIHWNPKNPMSFQTLCDQVLLEVIRVSKTLNPQKPVSLRRLAVQLGLSRNTLVARVKRLIDQNDLKEQDLL